MDTLSFFNRILASTGQRCICGKLPKGMDQTFWSNNIQAEEKAQRLDANKRDVYVAVATFRDSSSRKAPNALAAKAHILDLDCGEGKPYATQGEAAQALKRFCRAVGLPLPLVVNSGGGLHVWFVHAEDVPAADWKRIADKLKACARAYGLEADPSRTGDIASLLRVPGTHNRKRAKPAAVAVVAEGTETPADAFEAALDEALAAAGVSVEGEDAELPEGGPARPLAGANDDLKAGIELTSIPSSAERMADNCPVMDEIRRTKGAVDQPTWYHGLQVLQHTAEAPGVCHDWSKGDPRYTKAETDRVLARLKGVGPTTCAKFEEIRPDLCALCTLRGTVKSPIVLGRIEEVIDQAVTKLDEDGNEVELELVTGYRWGLYEAGKPAALLHSTPTQEEDKETETTKTVYKWDAVCETLFYATQRLRKSDGEWALEFERVVQGDRRRFTVDTATIGEGGKGLASILGRNEIVAMPGMKTKLENYLGRWVDHLRETADEVVVQDHFGWVGERSFLVGDTLVTPDGPRTVPLKGVAKNLREAYQTKGEFDEWRRVIDTAYNYPGQEAYQYLVLLSFAAPLFAMFGQYGGITVHAFSQGSGVGKTTAQRAGMSAWGNWEKLQLTDKMVTTNALWSRVGVACNLPVMLDELTLQQGVQAAEVVFALSSGQSKQRLNAQSELKAAPPTWSTILMTSANNPLSEKLTSHRADAEAELARLFEVKVTNTSRLSPNEALDLFPSLVKNYGHAGLQFITYVVENYDKVMTKLNTVHREINAVTGVTQKERYWSALQASVLTALFYCRKLDILQFDLAAMQRWALSRVGENRQQLSAAQGDPEELFGRMLNTLWSGILVTDVVGDMRRYSQEGKSCAARVIEEMRPGFNELYGRAILSPAKGEEFSRPTLLLSAKAAREWCSKNGVSAQDMFNQLVRAGQASPKPTTFSLGRGTLRFAGVSAPVRCWEIYLDALGEVSPVVRFSVAQ